MLVTPLGPNPLLPTMDHHQGAPKLPHESLSRNQSIVHPNDTDEQGNPLTARGHGSFTANLSRYAFLIVDDNEINLLILVRLLRKLFPNAQTAQFSDARAVVRHLSAGGHYDIMFLDIEMPEMSGVDLTRALNQNPGLSRPTVLIAVTSRFYPEALEEYRSVGIDHTWRKPLAYNYQCMIDCCVSLLHAKDCKYPVTVPRGVER